MTPAGALVHDKLLDLGGWQRSRALVPGLTLDDLILLGYHPAYVSIERCRTPGYAGRRIARHLISLREEGHVERRIRIEETRNGGMIPVGEWRAR